MNIKQWRVFYFNIIIYVNLLKYSLMKFLNTIGLFYIFMTYLIFLLFAAWLSEKMLLYKYAFLS